MREIRNPLVPGSLRFAFLAVSFSVFVTVSGCGKEGAPATGRDSTSSADSGGLESPPPSDSEGQAAAPTQPTEGDGSVAIQVNERVVTVEEFERDLQKQMDRLQQRLGNVEQGPEIEQRLAMIRDQMKRQLVEQTVTRLLLEDYIARSDMTATEEEVDGEWNRIAAQFPDAKTFEKVLEEEGVTVAEVREQVTSQVKLDKLMAREVGESEVTDAEAQAFYDLRPEEFAQPAQVRARHILLRDKEGAEEAIQKLHQRIEEGEDFAALAGEFSECPSGKQGGDLGFFGEGQMVEPFSRQAFAMKAGEVSAPIHTEFGYHIIKVEEHREAKQAEFAEVQEAIKQHLGEERAHVKQDEFIERLKKAAAITVNVALPSPPAPFPEPDEQLQ